MPVLVFDIETIPDVKGICALEDLPAGLLFIAYGPLSSALMGSETAGSGMPMSKNIEVEVEAVVG